jgi:vancomycin resistance protein VanW
MSGQQVGCEFLKIGDEFYRKNEIWRNRIAKFESGKILDTELLIKNYAKVKYIPEQYEELSEN